MSLGDYRKPEGVAWGPYLAFLRDALKCAFTGHLPVEGKIVRDAPGDRPNTSRKTIVVVCPRCGRPAKESSYVGQFPRRR